MPRVEIDGVRYIEAPEHSGQTSAANHLFFCEDLGRDITIKGYLKELLRTLWEEGEGFSGKRPFGNSGWEFDLYKPLIEGGHVTGVLDDEGCIATVDTDQANQIIFDIIAGL